MVERRRESLSSYTTWRVGGEAEIYFPKNIEEIKELTSFFEKKNFPLRSWAEEVIF